MKKKRSIVNPGLLEIGERRFQIQYDFEAIAEAEDLTDRPLLTGLTRRQVNSPSINFVRAMLYAGTRRHHAKLIYPEIAALITRQNIMAVWGDLLNAWVDSRQQEVEQQEEDPTPAPREAQEFQAPETL